jgi:hypothetical protein
MSDESLGQAREQLRQQFIGYVEALATGDASNADIVQIIRLRQAIDALDHGIDKGWSAPRAQLPKWVT